jgi:hypothetical protein
MDDLLASDEEPQNDSEDYGSPEHAVQQELENTDSNTETTSSSHACREPASTVAASAEEALKAAAKEEALAQLDRRKLEILQLLERRKQSRQESFSAGIRSRSRSRGRVRGGKPVNSTDILCHTHLNMWQNDNAALV